MAQDRWISLADAADFIGTPDAPRLIQLAWKRGAIRLRGVRAGESEPVEIPWSEDGTVDCDASRIGAGGLLSTYHSVTVKWADVKRLANFDARRLAKAAGTPASPPPVQTPQSVSSSADIEAAEAGPKTKAVAVELRRQFGQNRPPLPINELKERVVQGAGNKLGVWFCSSSSAIGGHGMAGLMRLGGGRLSCAP
jgi:hypothetical protein